MTTKIYSKLDPSKLLHMIVRETPEGRTNLCPENEFLQVASLRLPDQTTFKPHQHRWHDNTKGRHITQEAWIVVKGQVFGWWYDTDGKLLYSGYINPGECSITFSGGHNYQLSSDESLVYEVKTGPYIDQEHDKTLL